jgi:nicotinic acid mononucleotide adenylyltransferase
MGADLVVESPKWFGFEEIKKIAPPLVLARVGVDGANLGTSPDSLLGALSRAQPLLPALSSTEVREKLAAKAWDELAALVPRGVLAYIRAHGLYG